MMRLIDEIKLVLFLLATVLFTQTHAATISVTLKDNNAMPLSDAVVYIQPINPPSIENKASVQIEQRNKEFNPFVSVIHVGSTALFPNHDGIGHHVYSFSDTKTFELPLSEVETTESILFDRPGVVTVGCNIHDWMVAYIYILDTPYYSISTNEGTVTISDIPPGEYTLHIRHPGSNSSNEIEEKINVVDGNNLQRDYSINIQPDYFWKPVHPPEDEEELY